MRSHLTCLVNFSPRIILPVSSQLACLACATTPFPFENLEEGMMAEAVREKFGEPVATNTVWDPPGVGVFRGSWFYAADSSWTYVDEGRNWGMSGVYSLLFPIQIIESAIGSLVYSGDDDFRWDWAYVIRKPVVLYFEQEKLVRWEVIKPYYPDYSPDMNTDMQHHSMGHTHHHGH